MAGVCGSDSFTSTINREEKDRETKQITEKQLKGTRRRIKMGEGG